MFLVKLWLKVIDWSNKMSGMIEWFGSGLKMKRWLFLVLVGT